MRRNAGLLTRVRGVMRGRAAAPADPPSPLADRPDPAAARVARAARADARKAADELARCEAEARYHRDRLALYRARGLSAKPTTATRLRELQRSSEAADLRLARAKGR